MSKRKKIIAQNEISEMYTFTLGGYEQKVLIEGKKKVLPVLISLHGGPGSPIPFSAGNPNLQCRIMPNCGHMFGTEGMEEVLRILCEMNDINS